MGRQALAAVWFLGLLVVVALAVGSLPREVPGAAPRERNWVFGRLDNSTTFGQEFIIEQPGLSAFQVLLFAPRELGATPVTLTLFLADVPDFELASVTVPASELASDGFSEFRLPPLLAGLPASTALYAQLAVAALPAGTAITVIAGPDTYPHGDLWRNGAEVDRADLAFQPVYRQYLIEPLLPISHLAAGKPGLPGMPLFYTLVLIVFILLLFGGLPLLWRRMPYD